jgi:hypothetical protein
MYLPLGTTYGASSGSGTVVGYSSGAGSSTPVMPAAPFSATTASGASTPGFTFAPSPGIHQGSFVAPSAPEGAAPAPVPEAPMGIFGWLLAHPLLIAGGAAVLWFLWRRS